MEVELKLAQPVINFVISQARFQNLSKSGHILRGTRYPAQSGVWPRFPSDPKLFPLTFSCKIMKFHMSQARFRSDQKVATSPGEPGIRNNRECVSCDTLWICPDVQLNLLCEIMEIAALKARFQLRIPCVHSVEKRYSAIIRNKSGTG